MYIPFSLDPYYNILQHYTFELHMLPFFLLYIILIKILSVPYRYVLPPPLKTITSRTNPLHLPQGYLPGHSTLLCLGLSSPPGGLSNVEVNSLIATQEILRCGNFFLPFQYITFSRCDKF